ncbi:OLC1v1000557C1 [Oldenlandia corymbosa var. corymbosa]|uniref:OLC1v1000557C1 n=1 Tax=Oldenlandia corymbosa var. corymbosa TaxID=529605 RepID=A0AAV1D383_OLDCO|nr:OLC1v1000557C1 [Oldenlandia corymbosa var. corymbosa]
MPLLKLPCNDSCLNLCGSCHGILCFVNIFRLVICLCNPVTHECFKLPNSRTQTSALVRGFHLVELGFGYDPSTKDYKIITILEAGDSARYDRVEVDNSILVVEVYKLSTKCWSRVEHNGELEFLHSVKSVGSGVVFNGILYWWMESRAEPNDKRVCHAIVTFDFHSERFGRMECLQNLSSKDSILTVIGGGSLAFVRRNSNMESGDTFDVWVVYDTNHQEEDQESSCWTKKCSVAPSSVGPYLRQLTCWNHDELLLVNLGPNVVNHVIYDDDEDYIQEQVQELASCRLLQEDGSSLEEQHYKAVDIGRDLVKSSIFARALRFYPSLVPISARGN